LRLSFWFGGSRPIVPRVGPEIGEVIEQPPGEPDVLGEVAIVHLGRQRSAGLPGGAQRSWNGQVWSRIARTAATSSTATSTRAAAIASVSWSAAGGA